MHKKTLILAVPLALMLAVGSMGCPTAPKPDLDDSPDRADLPRVPADFEVKDSLDVPRHDKVDWKKFDVLTTGTATLKVHVGGFDGTHDLTGEAEIFSAGDRASLAKAAITPAEGSYDLVFDVEEGQSFYFVITATKGASDYTLYLSIEELILDPCHEVDCGDEAECIEGECVRYDFCDPACPDGEFCVNRECQEPCADGCERGQKCDEEANECVKDPCYGKRCGSGAYCYNGRCIKRRTTPKDPCDSCKDDEVCKDDECVPKSTDDGPVEGGPISGRIIQLLPMGKKTVLTINRGSKAGVKVGQTGAIAGVGKSFKVTEVYTFRSKAVVDAEMKDIGEARGFTIRP